MWWAIVGDGYGDGARAAALQTRGESAIRSTLCRYTDVKTKGNHCEVPEAEYEPIWGYEGGKRPGDDGKEAPTALVSRTFRKGVSKFSVD